MISVQRETEARVNVFRSSILINANLCLSVTLKTRTILVAHTFNVYQTKRIEKTNLLIVVIWLYVYPFQSKSRKRGF